MLDSIDSVRLSVAGRTAPGRKSALGQFFTPASTARFMAGLFEAKECEQARLLDAGAGIGSLSAAFAERREGLGIRQLHIEAFEQDESIHPELFATLTRSLRACDGAFDIAGGDFIEAAVNRIQFDARPSFTHAILNPPYKKIASDSRHRLLLRQAGIEAGNLYSAFVALALDLMAKGGQLVAIVPRSFCNGPYYRPFRERILERAAIRRIHLFDSRTTAFKDDGVLQENVIIVLERDALQGPVTISTSTDDLFSDLQVHVHSFERIVFPGDSERFIHVPTTEQRCMLEDLPAARFSLAELGIQVSTGPVVDFRLKSHLRAWPEAQIAPLLYPGHFDAAGLHWPKPEFKKANAIALNVESAKWLFPTGHYCVVRRFSSKEEVRRVVAHHVSPTMFPGIEMLGFENHLNVFHVGKRGLDESLAVGLSVYLNSTAVDESFRRFNGHTQVNATDLRLIKYPSVQILTQLGEWRLGLDGTADQRQIDETVMAALQ